MGIRHGGGIVSGERLRSRRGVAPLVSRALLLAILAAALVVHHGAAIPGHGPPAAHGHGECASCDHDGSGSDAVLIACVAVGIAALLAPRHPGTAAARRLLPARLAPRSVAASIAPQLRAPPPPPGIDRLCVRLR